MIAGAGFAGFNAARELVRLVGAATEIVVINSTDYFLYLPLMPHVTGGLGDVPEPPRQRDADMPRLHHRAAAADAGNALARLPKAPADDSGDDGAARLGRVLGATSRRQP